MANPGISPARNSPLKPQHRQNKAVNEEIYDLNEPYLVPRLFSECSNNSREITCRFLAIPLNEPTSFSYDISQYGTIVQEDRNKLIMRVPAKKLDFVDRIRQIWVSKYLAPFTECTITFSLPAKRGRNRNTTAIIVQRVLPKINENRAASLVSDATEGSTKTAGGTPHTPSTTNGISSEMALPDPVVNGRETTPLRTQRVCNYRAEKMRSFVNEWGRY
ncbi:hypothetical protein HD806DRAFT_156929 [Xylariaceae sp. AK1471]|nr:hypothetical protein HD806DRAFT_156929 [Xylariaceae sp. AK1471]